MRLNAAGDQAELGTQGPHSGDPLPLKWKRASIAAGLCYGSCGGGAALALHHQVGAYDTTTLIGALEGLRRSLGSQKATLLWDGLAAHRSHAMRAWLGWQRSWLVVEPLPAYAPELNPMEPLWSSLKGVELANLAGESHDVIAAAECGIHRIRHTHTPPALPVPAPLWPVPLVSGRQAATAPAKNMPAQRWQVPLTHLRNWNGDQDNLMTNLRVENPSKLS